MYDYCGDTGPLMATKVPTAVRAHGVCLYRVAAQSIFANSSRKIKLGLFSNIDASFKNTSHL